MVANETLLPLDPLASSSPSDIEAELAWLSLALDAPGWAEALRDREVAGFLKQTGSYVATAPLDPRKRAWSRVAAVGLTSLPAVLAPVPAFAAQPLPPNLAVAMAARPAAPPGLAAAGTQVLPLAPSMRQLNQDMSPRTMQRPAPLLEKPSPAKGLQLNPRLRSLLAGPRPVRLASGHQSARLYQVAKGDTLYSIAGDLLGSGARWRELLAANGDRINSAYTLRVGQSLRVPTGPMMGLRERPALLASYVPSNSPPHPAMPHRYQVARGDSLYLIAAKRLGNANRWREIVAANPHLSGTTIFPNQWLALPRAT